MISKFIQTSEQRQQSKEAALRNHDASIHNLENQVGQIAKMLSERSQGSLPGNTETNPREQDKAITLKSGRELQFNKCGETPVAMKEKRTSDKSEAPKEDDKSSSLEVTVKEPKKTKAPTV